MMNYDRLLRAHGVIRKIWSGRPAKKPPTPEALLRSVMVEEALKLTNAEDQKFLEQVYFSDLSCRSLCEKLAVSESTLYRMRLQALKSFGKAYDSLQ